MIFALFFLLFTLDLCSQRTLSSLSCSNWLWLLEESAVWALTFTSAKFILGKWSKPLYCISATFITLVAILELYVFTNFGFNFHGDWLLLMQATSPDELREFWVGNRLAVIFGVSAILGCCVLVNFLVLKSKYPRPTRRRVLIGVILLLSALAHDSKLTAFHKIGNSLISGHVLVDTVRNIAVFHDVAHIRNHPDFPKTISFTNSAEDIPLVVVVIGESATRNNWHLYGYERPTTPAMDARADELLVARDLVGVWIQTPHAVRYLCSMADCDHRTSTRFTLAQVLNLAGYETYFFSRQPHWGAWESLISYLFDSADHVRYIMDEKQAEDACDADLLPCLAEALDDLERSQRPTAVMLHMHGSHYSFATACPEANKIFGEPGKRTTMDDYDNSIQYQDRILGEIITAIEAKRRPAFFLYVTDHGETPRASSWRVNNDIDLWELPCVFWLSNEFRTKFPERVDALAKAVGKPLQSDQLLPLVLSSIGIEGIIEDRKNPAKDTFVPRSPRLISNWHKPYPEKR